MKNLERRQFLKFTAFGTATSCVSPALSASNASVSPVVSLILSNDSPLITSQSSYTIVENTTYVANIEVNDDQDSEGDGIVYSISGGADSTFFTINPSTGDLSFSTAPDFDFPQDTGQNNIYNVQATATDSEGLSGSLDISVTVENSNSDDCFLRVTVTNPSSVEIDPVDFNGDYTEIFSEGLLNGVPIYRDLSNSSRSFSKATVFSWVLNGANGTQLTLDSVGPEDMAIPTSSEWRDPLNFSRTADVTIEEIYNCRDI